MGVGIVIIRKKNMLKICKFMLCFYEEWFFVECGVCCLVNFGVLMFLSFFFDFYL